MLSYSCLALLEVPPTSPFKMLFAVGILYMWVLTELFDTQNFHLYSPLNSSALYSSVSVEQNNTAVSVLSSSFPYH